MNDTPTPRDCKHGRLARSCEICELERELAEAKATNDQLCAECERLKAHWKTTEESLHRKQAELNYETERNRNNVAMWELQRDQWREVAEMLWKIVKGKLSTQKEVDEALAAYERLKEETK